MEEKLAAYKRRRKREETISNLKSKFFNMFTRNTSDSAEKKVLIDIPEKVSDIDDETDSSLNESISTSQIDTDRSEETNLKDSKLNYVFYFLSFMCWATVYVIAIKFGFGVVYLLISALIGIYLNTRTTPKKAGEVSAYSVFNKGCHSIDGTLKAEQFEREIRYGASSVR